METSWKRLDDVLKMSWRRYEEAWPMRIYWSWQRRFEDAMLRPSYSSWSRRLEDVFWRRRRKTSSRHLHDVFINTVCWVAQAFNIIKWKYKILNIFKLLIRHSHKKQKDSLEGSLDRVLFAAELGFLMILVPRLPQHTSYVNTECAGKSAWSKQLYYLHVTRFLLHWYVLILLFWY